MRIVVLSTNGHERLITRPSHLRRDGSIADQRRDYRTRCQHRWQAPHESPATTGPLALGVARGDQVH